MKKCPKCGKELKTKVLGSIDVDECESCKGVWLDVGELGKAEEAADPNINWLDFEIWKHPEKFIERRTSNAFMRRRRSASSTGTRE
jgi:Zn-finger nucleic acid-binding protein